ncbi:HAD-IC family P-type ATPase, partial [Patescibacteria group bacterium]|nr:HAD-IC family P-type ATPase [Patescibacteria group bacterium]
RIEAFNSFALIASFAVWEIRSAAFIVLMLAFASLLDWFTQSRTHGAMEELLKLKPETALRERNGNIEEVAVEAIKKGDEVVVKAGARVPVDGTVVFGSALVNESSVNGESVPAQKVVGDAVFSSTLNESGMVKVRAERVGADSTIERLVALVKEASLHKSRSEKMADRFAGIFLPLVLAFGAIVFFITRDIRMTAAIFLVACADDMALAIPLATVAAIGRAAQRGVIVKGGEWFEALARMNTLVLDKTGTLTFGAFAVEEAYHIPEIAEDEFWRMVAVAEKFSEHPVGKIVFREAASRFEEIPDPDEFRAYKGSGVWARIREKEVAVGNEGIIRERNLFLPRNISEMMEKKRKAGEHTVFFVFFNAEFAGFISVADQIRPEAKESMDLLRRLGVSRVIMFTGD